MTQTRVQRLYDRHIRDLPPAERLRLLVLLASDLANVVEQTETLPEHDIMKLYGLGAERGIGMDAQEYVRRLREGRSVHPSEA